MKYFFDTNVISKLANNDTETKELVKKIIEEQGELYINRLVYAEALRAIPLRHSSIFKKTKAAIDLFAKVDITEEIYQESVAFARFCKSKGLSFGKCEIIDYIHFITAKHYSLEMVSHDRDMARLEENYSDFLRQKAG